MKYFKLYSLLLMAVSIILGVASFILLPDYVVTQISLGGNSATTMPKAAAVLIPLALGVVGSIMTLVNLSSDENNASRGLIVSAVGIIVYLITLAVNL